VNVALETAYEKDVSILDDIPTRKEKRKAAGLVRLTAGVADERQVSVEEAWAGLQDTEEEEGEEDDDVEDLDEGMSVDEEDEDEAPEEEEEEEEQPDSEEEEEAPPLLSNKQKRKRTLEKSIPERPSKKVAFAPRLLSKNSRSGSKRSGDALVRSSLILSAKHTLMITSAQQVDSALRLVHTAAKKPEKSKSAIAASKPIKSSLSVKGFAGGAPARPSSEVKGKVANVSTKTKAKATSGVEKSGNGPEAYDFGKFF
jgi:nuclear GTP-binding protein